MATAPWERALVAASTKFTAGALGGGGVAGRALGGRASSSKAGTTDGSVADRGAPLRGIPKASFSLNFCGLGKIPKF